MCAASGLPSTMRAAVYLGERRLEVQERAVPGLGPREALLRVSHCGVCGTDLHFVMEGWGRPDSIGGHEYSGRIAALGAEVTGAWSIGDAVVAGPLPACGRCEACRARRPGLCELRDEAGLADFQGAFAEYVRVAADSLLRVPPGLALREAALAEPLAVALHGISLSGVRPGQRALVTGAGPIGALTLAALRARGVADVIVSEPRPVRRTLAEKLGAARSIDPEELRVPSLPFGTADEPFDAVFECSGAPAAFETGLAQLRRAGTLVVVGTGMKRPRLDANRVLLNELVVTGAYCYDENGVADALALLASHRLPTDLLIEARDVPLDGIQQAMQELVEGRLAAKVLVAPHAA